MSHAPDSSSACSVPRAMRPMSIDACCSTSRRAQQGADLLLAVARGDPGRVLHRPEAQEAQPLGELGALDAAVLGDRVPDDGPGVRRGRAAAEREDAPVALGEQLVRARAEHVEDEPSLAVALSSPRVTRARQRGAGGLGGEPELAEDLDHAAGPDALAGAPQVAPRGS